MTARPRRSRISSPASPTRPAPTSTQFALWYHQAGTPTVTLAHRYDAAAERLTLRPEAGSAGNARPHAEAADAHPGRVRAGRPGRAGPELFARAGGADVPTACCTSIDGQRGSGVRGRAGARRSRRVFREFSAPVQVQSDLSAGRPAVPDRQRSRPVQPLGGGAAGRARHAGARDRRDPRAERRRPSIRALPRSSAASPTNEELDAAFRALALQLPSEIDIAQAIGRDIDPDAIHRARAGACRRCSAERSARRWLEAAARSAPGRTYSPDAENAGRRAFTHAAWNLAVAGGGMQAADLARFYRDAGTSPTAWPRCASSSIAASTDAEDALTSFFGRYRDNPLVLDKWFAVQATAPEPRGARRVSRRSAHHPSFSFKNPNRVYALIRSFAACEPGRLQPPRRRRLPLRRRASSATSTGRILPSPRGSRPPSAPAECWSRDGAAMPRQRCGNCRNRSPFRATSATS